MPDPGVRDAPLTRLLFMFGETTYAATAAAAAAAAADKTGRGFVINSQARPEGGIVTLSGIGSSTGGSGFGAGDGVLLLPTRAPRWERCSLEG